MTDDPLKSAPRHDPASFWLGFGACVWLTMLALKLVELAGLGRPYITWGP